MQKDFSFLSFFLTYTLPSSQAEESSISRDLTEVARAVSVFLSVLHGFGCSPAVLRTVQQYKCKSVFRGEGVWGGAEWLPSHPCEMKTHPLGEAQRLPGQKSGAVGPGMWERGVMEGKFSLPPGALHMLWEKEPAVNLAAHFKTLWSRRAHCILIRAVSWCVIRDSWDLSDAVPWIFFFLNSWLHDMRFCSPTFCLKSGFSLGLLFFSKHTDALLN